MGSGLQFTVLHYPADMLLVAKHTDVPTSDQLFLNVLSAASLKDSTMHTVKSVPTIRQRRAPRAPKRTLSWRFSASGFHPKGASALPALPISFFESATAVIRNNFHGGPASPTLAHNS
jgi:hypothetical protein